MKIPGSVDTRVPPHDLLAETTVLGAAMVSADAMAIVLERLEADDFYSSLHRDVFTSIVEASGAGGVDRQTVLDALRQLPEHQKARAFVLRLEESVPTAINASQYANAVRRLADYRRRIDAGQRLVESSYGEHTDAGEIAINKLAEIEHGDIGANRVVKIGEVKDEVRRRLWASQNEDGGVTGLRSGIAKLDNWLKGFNSGRLYVIGAPTSTYKSLLGGQIALSVAMQGHPVFIQSTEMSAYEYYWRFAVAVSGVDAQRALDGNLDEQEVVRVEEAVEKISKLPIHIDDKGTQTVARARTSLIRYRPKLFFCDHIHQIRPADSRMSRAEQVSGVANDLKALARDFEVPVIAAAQLRRKQPAYAAEKPSLDDLKESGDIENATDGAIMLYDSATHEKKARPNELGILIRKNRQGRKTGDIKAYKNESLWITDEHQKWENF